MTAKRIFDFIAASFGIAVLSPLLLIIAFLVRSKHGSPVFFRQIRPGLNGKPFLIYKFRTMTNARDSTGELMSNDQRLTTFGKFLRSSSLDELPELINVLKGDMSLVGPRPLRIEYLPLYTPEQARRHELVPGITGWAQVNGRNAIAWEEKFKLDIWYVDNRTLLLDIKIIFMTLVKVFKREGVNQSAERTMDPFKGAQLHD